MVLSRVAVLRQSRSLSGILLVEPLESLLSLTLFSIGFGLYRGGL